MDSQVSCVGLPAFCTGLLRFVSFPISYQSMWSWMGLLLSSPRSPPAQPQAPRLTHADQNRNRQGLIPGLAVVILSFINRIASSHALD